LYWRVLAEKKNVKGKRRRKIGSSNVPQLLGARRKETTKRGRFTRSMAEESSGSRSRIRSGPKREKNLKKKEPKIRGFGSSI